MVVMNFLTRDERYVFSTFNAKDEETAEREAAAALEQGGAGKQPPPEAYEDDSPA